MKISSDVVVGLRYVIRDEAGQAVDRTPEGQPWFYLHGAKECPAGLEEALRGRTAGDKLAVQLPPEQTYGQRNENAVFKFDRGNLPGDKDPKVGMILSIMSKKGETELRVVNVTDREVTVDANHPLAGQTLTFDVVVHAVRPATAEEILAGEAKQTPVLEAVS